MAEGPVGWRRFFDQLSSFLDSSSRQLESTSEEYCDFVQERLETATVTLIRIRHTLASARGRTGFQDIDFTADELQALSEYLSLVTELIGSIQSLSQQWEQRIDSVHASSSSFAYRSTPISSGARGRPRVDVSRSQLEYLLSLSFTWTEIASLLGVSRMTIYRRRREFGMLDEGQAISDADLRSLLSEMQAESPEMGEVLILGRLRARHYKVTRDRVRRVIREIDPLSIAMRGPRGLTAWRPYSFPGPNSLWHVGKFWKYILGDHIHKCVPFYIPDGHHKLVRWRLVTHAGIDGYSRMIVL